MITYDLFFLPENRILSLNGSKYPIYSSTANVISDERATNKKYIKICSGWLLLICQTQLFQIKYAIYVTACVKLDFFCRFNFKRKWIWTSCIVCTMRCTMYFMSKNKSAKTIKLKPKTNIHSKVTVAGWTLNMIYVICIFAYVYKTFYGTYKHILTSHTEIFQMSMKWVQHLIFYDRCGSSSC